MSTTKDDKITFSHESRSFSIPAQIQDYYRAHATLREEDIACIMQLLYDFYARSARSMPWRDDYSPYSVFVSEVMLQQTQVDRVKDKYVAFMHCFPDIHSLAQASLHEVLTAWQGLGYNRRGKWLKEAAEQIVDRFQGNIPCTKEELVSLPGIGENTAGAILAYAFNIPVVFIETNIRTVFIYLFFQDEEQVSDSRVRELVSLSLDRRNPRKWYWAMMDLGVMLKKTYGNLTQKSSTYRKQSPFRNSNRQVRGEILKLLLESPGLSREKIIAQLRSEKRMVTYNIDKLIQEELVQEEQGSYYIGQ